VLCSSNRVCSCSRHALTWEMHGTAIAQHKIHTSLLWLPGLHSVDVPPNKAAQQYSHLESDMATQSRYRTGLILL
jgi:hypothetical protein